MKNFKMLCANVCFMLFVFTTIFSSCKKNNVLEENVGNGIDKKKKNAMGISSAGDEKWDLLGYGLDVTGDYLADINISDAPIIDMERFEEDYLHRIDVNTSTSGSESYVTGVTARDFMRNFSKEKSFDASGNAKIKGTPPEVQGQDSNFRNFTASFSKSSLDQNISKYSSKYSYARFDLYHRVKKIRFNGDVSPELLSQYLMPDFTYNLSVMSAEDLVERYGTHIMLDISIGGRLKFTYTGLVLNESEYQKKNEAVKMGLGFGVAKVFGININSNKSSTEVTETTMETRSKSWTGQYFGGSNTGRSIAIDKDGNSSENFNLGNWQSSITYTNASLIDVGKTIFLYDLITDPIKKGQVKFAVEKHIHDNQLKELGEVPVYQYGNHGNQDYFYNLNSNALQPSWPGWVFQGPAFYAFKSADNNATPIYEYRNHQQTRTIYSPNPNFIQPNWPGWSSAVIAFYAYTDSNTVGTVPVYEFYNHENECNLYSTNINAVFGSSGWVRLGIAFYAYPVDPVE